MPRAGAADTKIQIHGVTFVTIQSHLSNLPKKTFSVSFTDLKKQKKIFFEDVLHCFLDPMHSLIFSYSFNSLETLSW